MLSEPKNYMIYAVRPQNIGEKEPRNPRRPYFYIPVPKNLLRMLVLVPSTRTSSKPKETASPPRVPDSRVAAIQALQWHHPLFALPVHTQRPPVVVLTQHPHDFTSRDGQLVWECGYERALDCRSRRGRERRASTGGGGSGGTH